MRWLVYSTNLIHLGKANNAIKYFVREGWISPVKQAYVEKEEETKRGRYIHILYIRLFPYLATLQSHKFRMFRCQHQHSGVTRKRKADYTILPSFFGATTMTMTMSRTAGQQHRRQHYSHVVKLMTTAIISIVSFYYRQLTWCYYLQFNTTCRMLWMVILRFLVGFKWVKAIHFAQASKHSFTHVLLLLSLFDKLRSTLPFCCYCHCVICF